MGEEAPETFPHAYSQSPSPSPPPGTLSSPHRRSWPCPGRAETRGGARAAGVTCRESFQLLGAIPHPQGRASGRGQLGAPRLPLLRLPRRPRLRQLPQRSLRSGRPPASHGPHRGLIGSPNPRPCACSRRHLPLARPPGPRPRAPPRRGLQRLPGPAGARRANFPRGVGAAPVCPSSPGGIPSFPLWG